VDENNPESLLEQARRYRDLGNAMHDRQTRLALLELAFEFEERSRLLSRIPVPVGGAPATVAAASETEGCGQAGR
jgi:hypothetical protein